MNAQALELIPTATIWAMEAQFPESYAMQQAVKERDDYHRAARFRNSRDMDAAAEKRFWDRERNRWKMQ